MIFDGSMIRNALIVTLFLAASPVRALGPCPTEWDDSAALFPVVGGHKPGAVTSPTAVKLNAIHGRSRPNGGTTDRNNVWAVGDNGVIIRYNGTSWSTVTSPVSDVNLYDVYILPKANVDGWLGFAVGERGTILKMDSGGIWSIVNHPAAGDCGTVGGASPINICATLYDIFPVDNENENTALMAIGQPQDVPPNDCSMVPACPPWGSEPTILMYLPGTGWSRITSTPTGSGYKFSTFGWYVDYSAANPTSFTGIIMDKTGPTAPTDGAIFDSNYIRLTIGLDGATSTWKKIGTGADASPSNPAPRYYSSANTGSYFVYFGDTDTDNFYAGAITGAKTSTNMFCFINDGIPVRSVDIGMAAAKYGTVRAMDFLSLWGFGIGVGFGQTGGAGYTVVDSATNAYFMLMNIYDPTRLPAPEDPGSLNTVQCWQAPGAAWDRLNGCYITAYNEAWAVGNNGRILHWIGPAVPPAALDIALSTTRTGMWVQVTMTVTNTGGGVALSLATSMAPTPGSANLDCGPVCSTSYCVASRACPTTIVPTGVANFTWSYTMTGWYPVTFTGKADAIDLLSAKAVTDSAAITVAPPALAQMSITTNPFWPNNHIFTITMTVTNTGFKTTSPVTPAPALTGVPAGAVLLGGPTPPSFTPLGPGADTSFVYTYSATGALPWTFSGCVDLDLGGDGTEIVTACDNETTKTESNPLKASLSVETIIAGAKSYYSTLVLTITNTGGTEDALTVVPWISQPSAPASGIMTSGPTPPSVALIAAGGGQASFTWTYNVMGSLPFTFTACGSGFASSSGAPIMACAKSTANSAYSPLEAALSVSAVRGGATFYIATVVLTVTNVGSENVIDLTPAATLTAPANSILNVGSAPSVGPLPPGNGMSFTWRYVTPATIPLTFTGDLAALGSPSNANLYASATGTANSAYSSLAGLLSVSAVRSGANSYFSTLIMNVKNIGSEDAINFDAGVSTAPAGAVCVGGPIGPGGVAPPYAGPVPPSGSEAFTWWYNVTGSLPITFSATMTAQGSLSMAPEYTTATGSAVTATTPPLAASLAASIILSDPSSYSCTIYLTVTNNGSDTATIILPDSLLQAPPGSILASGPLPASAGPIPPGSSAVFEWQYTVNCTPPFAFTGCATASYPSAPPVPGYDGYVCATGSTSKSLPGQSPVASVAVTKPKKVGEWMTVSLTITNSGAATLTGMTPGASAYSGSAAVALIAGPSPPGPISINSGEAKVIEWTYSASGEGYAEFGAWVDGMSCGMTPIHLGGSVGLNVSARPMAALTASVTVGKAVMGSSFEVVVAVGNTGGAAAHSVTPVMGIPVGPTLVSLVSGPSPAPPVTLGPGKNQSFTWVYFATGSGQVGFSADVTGESTGGGGPVRASATGSVVVGPPETLAPGQAQVGLVTRHNTPGQVFVNPKQGDAYKFSMRPTGPGTVTVRIYNTESIQVNEILGESHGTNEMNITWDCKDSGGTLVAPGAYYVTIEAPGIRFKTWVAIVH